MKYKRMIIMIILLIFTVGMIMGTASASHTFKADGYKYKMSDKKFKVMKKHAKKHGSSLKKVKAYEEIYTSHHCHALCSGSICSAVEAGLQALPTCHRPKGIGTGTRLDTHRYDSSQGPPSCWHGNPA